MKPGDSIAMEDDPAEQGRFGNKDEPQPPVDRDDARAHQSGGERGKLPDREPMADERQSRR